MSKTICEVGKKEKQKRMKSPQKFECKKCEARAKKKDWLCKPVNL